MDHNLKRTVDEYARQRGITIHEFLGGGQDGDVWHSGRDTAIKVFHRESNYHMELACYQRLRENGVFKIEQFAVPRLVWHDDKLRVIEMSMVSPPCLIDFGKAYVDQEPEHTPETLAETEEMQRDLWEDRYPQVRMVMGILKNKHGIYYQDPNTRNIWFEGESFSGPVSYS